MSIEALSWAMNLADVPLDRDGKPSAPCASVLIGLANHAQPDGRDAFPAIETLVIYTRLSERTVQACLRRLAEAGVIRAGDPAMAAARISRADRRPRVYDLVYDRMRNDLTPEQVARLRRSYPWFGPMLDAAANLPENPETGQDGRGAAGAPRTGHGVQRTTVRGAAGAPEPKNEPKDKDPLTTFGAAPPHPFVDPAVIADEPRDDLEPGPSPSRAGGDRAEPPAADAPRQATEPNGTPGGRGHRPRGSETAERRTAPLDGMPVTAPPPPADVDTAYGPRAKRLAEDWITWIDGHPTHTRPMLAVGRVIGVIRNGLAAGKVPASEDPVVAAALRSITEDGVPLSTGSLDVAVRAARGGSTSRRPSNVYVETPDPSQPPRRRAW